MKKLIYLSVLLWTACGSSTQPAADHTIQDATSVEVVQITDVQMKNAGIIIGSAETKDLYSVVKVNGVVDVPPQNLVSISFPLGGYLKSTDLLPGAHVKKGQVIAVIEDVSFIEMQEEFLVASAEMKKQKSELERQRTLNTSKASSDKTLEQAESDYYATEARLSALRQKLLLIGISPEKLTASSISRSVNITSPIDGYVSDVLVNVGKYLNPTDVLFELVNPEDLHIALTVFEKDLASIHAGQKIRFTLTSDPTKTFNGEVVLTGRKLDENRSAEVHCHFNAEGTDVLPGMFVTGEIEVQKSGASCVPEGAVVRLRESEYIFLQEKPGQFRRVKVKTGISRDGWVEIETEETDLKARELITANAWSALMMMENQTE